MTTALSINLNKVALLRNSREGSQPAPQRFAQICIAAGCQGITVHPRPDQRHVRPDDVECLGELCRSVANVEFNIEGNPFAQQSGDYPGFMALVEAQQPDQVTLVPDSDSQLTSDHGFDLQADSERLQPIVDQLKDWGCRVSLFMDPEIKQIERVSELGADRIELYTGPYASLYANQGPASEQFQQSHHQYREAAQAAQQLGLGVNAGHDLNLENLGTFLQIPEILEVSIGHAFIEDALLMGMEKAAGSYLELIAQVDSASC